MLLRRIPQYLLMVKVLTFFESVEFDDGVLCRCLCQ